MSAARFENAKTRFSREERHVEERVRRPALPGDEGGEGHDAGPGERPPGGGGQPAQAVHERREPGPVEHRAGDVEAVAAATRATPPRRPHAASAAAIAPRAHVGHEDAAPAEVLRQQAAERRAQREAEVHRGHVHPEGEAPLPRREDRGEERDPGAEDHPAAEALGHPPGEEDGKDGARAHRSDVTV